MPTQQIITEATINPDPSHERDIKQAIFNKLSGDATLIALLGGESNIFAISPPVDVNYPCVVYEISGPSDYTPTSDETGKMLETIFRINIFSNSSKTLESDNIASRVKALLHGQRTLNNANIICYSCYRQTRERQSQDENFKVWVTTERYRLLSAPK